MSDRSGTEVLVWEYSYLCPEHGWQGPFDSMRDCPECVEAYCGLYEMGADGQLRRMTPPRERDAP